MQTNEDTVQVPEKPSSVGVGAQASYQAPPVPNALLNKIRPASIDLKEVEKTAEKEDSWYKTLLKKERDLLALPKVTKAQKAAAWKGVVTAYWTWLMISTHEEEVQAALKQVRSQKTSRILELKHKLTYAKIEELKKKLGNRFRLHLATSGGRQSPGLPRRITQGLSSLRKVTLSSQPPPSASDLPSFEIESPKTQSSEPQT